MKSKLPQTTTSIFSVMSALANKHKALNLSQGFPNFDIDKRLVELVTEAMQSGKNQYAPMPGVMALRAGIAQKVAAAHGRYYDPETEVTVTAGATQAIYTAITALIHPGDEVIVFAPAYDCYEPAIRLQGASAVVLQLPPPSYQVDWDQVRQAITPKTRMILINSPHNPCGSIFSQSDMQTLAVLAEKNDLFVLSDEVYEHIVFDGVEHQSAARFKSLAERTIITASFGKTFHATGWKMGYCLAPKLIMDEFRKVHQYLVFSVSHPVQQALATYIQQPENYLKLGEFYQNKRNLFLSCLEDTAFKAIPSKGTYFQLVDYSQVSTQNDVAFAKRLTAEYGLAAIPTSVFHLDEQNHFYLRFCFAKTDQTLLAAGKILKEIHSKIATPS